MGGGKETFKSLGLKCKGGLGNSGKDCWAFWSDRAQARSLVPNSHSSPLLSDYRIELAMWATQSAKDSVPLRKQQRCLLFTVR